MGKTRPPRRGVTPPKGRPTRSRGAHYRRRAFGPTFQWITVALVLLLAIVVLVMVTGGGNFNPFDDGA